MRDELAAALARHRDDSSPRLDLSVPIDRLIDGNYLDNIHGELQRAAPHGFERLTAAPTAWRMIPNVPGVYLFVWRPAFTFNAAGTAEGGIEPCFILYVGKAGGPNSNGTLKTRYKGEYSKYVGGDPDALWSTLKGGATRPELMKKWLTLTPLEYWFAEVADAALIGPLERHLYNLMSPPLNTSGGPRLRPGKRTSAF